MRYIFITLLLANIGYFGYAILLKSPPSPPVTATSPNRADTIFMLSENDSTTANNAVLNTIINNPVQQGDPSAQKCLAMGPFGDLFSGQALVRQLQAQGVFTELRAFDQATGENDYRVLIPPVDSLQDAFRKLRELKSSKIDSYVITRGQNALGISLGVFADTDAASKLQAKREKEGYEVKIVQMPRFNREYWIFSTKARDITISAQLWQSLVSEHGGLQRKPMPCPIRTKTPAQVSQS